MKKVLLFVLALAVIPVGVDAQDTASASCADISGLSPLEDLRSCGEQGYAQAQLYLGAMYANGQGVPEDYVAAVRWYRLAAEQGYAQAQLYLGHMYADGDGVPEDDAEAVRWFRLAAEQGYPSAQFQLGYLYANGEGVPEDYVLAYMWYNLAQAQGLGPAGSNKDIIEQQMTREQISEAQRMSREWIEAHPPGDEPLSGSHT
jgi:hypothetical protein